MARAFGFPRLGWQAGGPVQGRCGLAGRMAGLTGGDAGCLCWSARGQAGDNHQLLPVLDAIVIAGPWLHSGGR